MLPTVDDLIRHFIKPIMCPSQRTSIFLRFSRHPK